MTQPITGKQLSILQYISKHPNVSKDVLFSSVGATEADLAYLGEHDMIREREPGCFIASHFGGMVLRRSL